MSITTLIATIAVLATREPIAPLPLGRGPGSLGLPPASVNVKVRSTQDPRDADDTPPSGVEYSIAPDLEHTQSVTGLLQSDHKFECPAGFAIIGRFHQGDENGSTGYKYAHLVVVQSTDFAVVTDEHEWSEWQVESGGEWFRAPRDRIITGYEHIGDENGKSRYRTSLVSVLDTRANVGLREEGKRTKESAAGWYMVPEGRVLTGRVHDGDENGKTSHETGVLTVQLFLTVDSRDFNSVHEGDASDVSREWWMVIWPKGNLPRLFATIAYLVLVGGGIWVGSYLRKRAELFAERSRGSDVIIEEMPRDG